MADIAGSQDGASLRFNRLPRQSVTGFLATDCPDEVTRLRCGNLEDADDRTDMVIEDRNLRQLPE
jgi:hypothetical protein